MANPRIGGVDGITGERWEREMTDEEYEALLASGWTEEGSTSALGSHPDVQHTP